MDNFALSLLSVLFFATISVESCGPPTNSSKLTVVEINPDILYRLSVETDREICLTDHGFEILNKVCLSGTWVLYTGANFTGTTKLEAALVFESPYWKEHGYKCVRPIGNLTFIYTPTLTTFQERNYSGMLDEVIDSDNSSTSLTIRSLILTGGEAVVLYLRENYGGMSFCIENDRHKIGRGVENLPEETGLPESTLFKSVKFVSTCASMNTNKIIPYY